MQRLTATLALTLTTLFAATAVAQDGTLVASTSTPAEETKGAFDGGQLMYTTYFYTPTEAIVHGYADNTGVRIVSLKDNRTIWKGAVNRGEVAHIPTGSGVFGFLSDKKASILVGTPSTCTVVGYWLRDDQGTHLAKQFFGRVPASTMADDKLIVWAWEDTEVSVRVAKSDEVIDTKKLKAGERFEINGGKLKQLGNAVLDFQADKPIAVQVYFDEGFFVPGPDGRTAGKKFRTYVGKTTEGVNDLNLLAYFTDTKVKVRDIDTNEVLFDGTVPKGKAKTLTLAGKYVEVTAESEISVLVAPYEHYKTGYAEHHYGAGVEGTGIETEFLLTTPDELWIFSYFPGNPVEVIDQNTGLTVFKGELGAGSVRGLTPGHGLYRVKSGAGISVMGGDYACGAEYSPAAGLFRVDEELLKMANVVLEKRKEKARAEGRTLTDREASAPLSAPERKAVQRHMKSSLGKSMSEDEVQQRIDSIVTY